MTLLPWWVNRSAAYQLIRAHYFGNQQIPSRATIDKNRFAFQTPRGTMHVFLCFRRASARRWFLAHAYLAQIGQIGQIIGRPIDLAHIDILKKALACLI